VATAAAVRKEMNIRIFSELVGDSAKTPSHEDGGVVGGGAMTGKGTHC